MQKSVFKSHELYYVSNAGLKSKNASIFVLFALRICCSHLTMLTVSFCFPLIRENLPEHCAKPQNYQKAEWIKVFSFKLPSPYPQTRFSRHPPRYFFYNKYFLETQGVIKNIQRKFPFVINKIPVIRTTTPPVTDTTE